MAIYSDFFDKFVTVVENKLMFSELCDILARFFNSAIPIQILFCNGIFSTLFSIYSQ